VCATSSVRDALALEGQVTLLSQGAVVGQKPALGCELAPGNVNDYVVRTTRARELTAALMHRHEVVGVDYDGRLAPRVVRVQGRDGERVTQAIVEVARSEQIPVESLAAEDPSLQLAQSASLGAMRAAYDQAYRAVMPITPAAAPHPQSPPAPPTPTVPTAGLNATPASSLPGVAPGAVPLGSVSNVGVGLSGTGAVPAALSDVIADDRAPADSQPAAGEPTSISEPRQRDPEEPS
jgi:hypothetical protein